MPETNQQDNVETETDQAGADNAADLDNGADDNGADDARVTRANRQAAQYRTQLRQTEGKVTELEQALAQQGSTLQQLAAVFNPGAAETDDPAETVRTITAEADTLRTELQQARTELAVHNLAAEHGGNPNALLDSRAFLNTLQALDASADDYQEQVAEAIRTAVASNANLSASGPAPARGGATGAGQGSVNTGVTQEHFDAMALAQRNELFRTDPDTYRRLADSIR